MNYSDSIKAILLAAINELSKIPENYAVKPGVDFIRNRKLGFKDYMLMFLTMEADCIRKELYRFFGRMMHLPKPLFISSEKKSKKTLFGIFFLLLTENFLKSFITVNMNSGPAMVLPAIFSLTLRIRTCHTHDDFQPLPTESALSASATYPQNMHCLLHFCTTYTEIHYLNKSPC